MGELQDVVAKVDRRINGSTAHVWADRSGLLTPSRSRRRHEAARMLDCRAQRLQRPVNQHSGRCRYLMLASLTLRDMEMTRSASFIVGCEVSHGRSKSVRGKGSARVVIFEFGDPILDLEDALTNWERTG